MSSVANRIVKNTGWLYAKMGIVMIISFYTTRLVLSALGAEDFGVYNVVGGAITMLGFLSSAMASSTQRFMSYAEGENDMDGKVVIFNISVAIHLIVAILSAIILVAAGFLFFNGFLNIPEGRISAAYVVYGGLIVSTVFTIATVPYEAVLNSHENMKYYSIISVVDSLLKLGVAFLCLHAKTDRLETYGILMALVSIITLCIMRVYCHRNYVECKVSVFRYFDWGKTKEMVNFALWSMLGHVGALIGNYGQTIISNRFFGVAINAAEGVCAQIHAYLLVFANNMLKSLNPVIVKSEGEHDREKMMTWTLRGCKFSYVLLLWLSVPFSFEIDYILNLWLTEVPEWSGFFIKMVFIRSQMDLAFGCLVTSLGACGDIKNYNKIYSFLLLIALLIVYVANAHGAGPDFRYWLLIVFNFIQWVSAVLLSKTVFGLSIIKYIRRVVVPICVLTVFLIITSFITTHILEASFSRLIITCLSTWVVLGVSFFTFYTDNFEKEFIRSTAIKLVRRFS